MMKFADLPVHVRQEVENALLPGEEVRYVSRPKTSFVKVLLRGDWALFAFSLFWNLFIWIFIAVAVWQVLVGTKSLAFLVSVYAILLLFVLAGWLIASLSTSDARYLKAAWYLVTTRRVMILRPGNMIQSRPLSAELISHVEVRPDGSGFLYFCTGEKKDELRVDESFAFIPEVRRVESLINELAGQLQPLPPVECPPVDWEILEPACRKRLQENLEPDEQVLWVGRSLPARQVVPPRDRRLFCYRALVAFSGCICAGVCAVQQPLLLILGAIYLGIAVLLLWCAFGSGKSNYAITSRRVCSITPKEVLTFSRELTSIEQCSTGAVTINLKSDEENPQDIQYVADILPALILLRSAQLAS